MQQRSQDIVFTKRPYIEDVGPRRIKSIKFSMFSDSEIAKAAEVQVYKGVYYDPQSRPIEGGLLDPRMGPPNKSGKCATCDGSFGDCPGHYGYLPLVLPVYNVGYLSTILDILKCICKSCSRILLDDKLAKDYLKKMRAPKTEPLKKAEIMKSVVKKCTAMAGGKAVKCSRCGYLNGTVKKAPKMIGVFHDRSKVNDNSSEELKSAISHTKESKSSINTSSVLNPVKVLSLFKRMTDVDCELLYLSDRPEKFIITNIAVPPTAIRPSVPVDSNENDITERLKRIIQANSSLRQQLVDSNAAFHCLNGWDLLQVDVAQYINSDVRGVPTEMQPSRPLSGFLQRLKGKQGRFRGNLSGKRVEFTGRTVISPDPNLKITEVAIPIHMARILSYPERVSSHNIEKLRQCVRNGPSKYPGAVKVRYPDGSARLLIGDYRKRLADELKFGCIVDRHLEDGDIVLFNRQPSLHRMSIMCHRARIMPWRTLRFNESVCNPYNADFDGDEMNMHVPQTEEARTEALMLMGPVELWTGKQLFNVLLRPHASVRVYLNLTVKERNYSRKIAKRIGDKEIEVETMCPNDGFVYIRNSELICGQLGKATLGNGNKDGLYSILLRDYNAHAAATCMNRLAKMSARWIGNHGFSIGIDDVQPGKRLNDAKGVTLSGNYKKCDEQIQMFNEGKLQLKPGCDAAQTLEANITEVLNKIRDETGKVCMRELHWRNSPLIMSQCGSKGSAINISQMIACVGQQSVGGRRAPNGFIDRSLPHFHRGSKTPAAKGFVANSFYSGLTATEFFFHTMGGREGLVDTAATCPPVDQKYLPADAIPQMLEEQVVKHDPDGVCSEAFKKSLKGFLEGQKNELKRVMQLVSNSAQKNEILEDVSHKICGITDRQLEVFIRICIGRYRSKVIEAGTAIGAIGAQSIGEPGTQMTLKTFHFAGVASMKLEFDSNVNVARMVKGRIEKTVLGQVAKSIKIVMTSRLASVVISLDMERIQDAQLHIDANVVKESILQTPKLKLKEQGIKNVERVVIAEKKKDNKSQNKEAKKLYQLFVEGLV
ncbi:DNA-directed RNA polymerase III subunit RPC1 [Gossypium arboreum]|uniref:DNA-directed RNA polymerase subunit n=1 Tax=Gossypium arboreum TaxID=29729 RepID=A0A0B0MY34_GOSAR|nr:DNA-directed RNA polymerase III subunit RPC1 [Gossypium arboreum]